MTFGVLICIRNYNPLHGGSREACLFWPCGWWMMQYTRLRLQLWIG